MPSDNLNITHVTTGQDDKLPTINEGFDALDDKITETYTANFASDADLAVTQTQSVGATRILVTGAHATARNLTVPDASIGFYWVIDNTTTGTATTFKTLTGTGIVLDTGAYSLCYNDGTNMVLIGVGPPIVARRVDATAGGTEDIDFDVEGIVIFTLTSNCTLTFSNEGNGKVVHMQIKSNAAETLAFPASVKILSGITYSTAGAFNYITILCTDDDTEQIVTIAQV